MLCTTSLPHVNECAHTRTHQSRGGGRRREGREAYLVTAVLYHPQTFIYEEFIERLFGVQVLAIIYFHFTEKQGQKRFSGLALFL